MEDPQGLDDCSGCIQGHATLGHVVVGRDHQEDGMAVADALRNEWQVVDAAVKDVDLLVVGEMGQQVQQLGPVAAVRVDLAGAGLEEVLDQGSAAVSCRPQNRIGHV